MVISPQKDSTVLIYDTYLFVVFERIPDDDPHALLHAALDLQHPVLHVPCGVERLHEGHILTLSRVHPGDLQVLLKLQL